MWSAAAAAAAVALEKNRKHQAVLDMEGTSDFQNKLCTVWARFDSEEEQERRASQPVSTAPQPTVYHVIRKLGRD